jgi:hypothetical protein
MRTYTNKRGETFQIDVKGIDLSPGADHWRVEFRVSDQAERKKTFTVFLKKSRFPDREAAERFSLGDPMSEMEQRLEATENGRTDLVWPDQRDGWALA